MLLMVLSTDEVGRSGILITDPRTGDIEWLYSVQSGVSSSGWSVPVLLWHLRLYEAVNDAHHLSQSSEGGRMGWSSGLTRWRAELAVVMQTSCF